jgi:hypothetical protein
LVNLRPELVLFGRHESSRTEHSPHGVSERAIPIVVEIHDVHLAGRKVEDQATIVEVARDPTSLSQVEMETENYVECSDALSS